jgi:hypothetical protein
VSCAVPVIGDIELRTNDEAAVLRMSNAETFAANGSYRCDLFVRSKGFSCERPFYFDDAHFPGAIDALRKMNDGRVGEALIAGQWETDYIRFASDELGHVLVAGELTEHGFEPQSLRFAFLTDQTVLSPLTRDFERLLNA